jgi:hypothetical protein
MYFVGSFYSIILPDAELVNTVGTMEWRILEGLHLKSQKSTFNSYH